MKTHGYASMINLQKPLIKVGTQIETTNKKFLPNSTSKINTQKCATATKTRNIYTKVQSASNLDSSLPVLGKLRPDKITFARPTLAAVKEPSRLPRPQGFNSHTDLEYLSKVEADKPRYGCKRSQRLIPVHPKKELNINNALLPIDFDNVSNLIRSKADGPGFYSTRDLKSKGLARLNPNPQDPEAGKFTTPQAAMSKDTFRLTFGSPPAGGVHPSFLG